MNIVQEPKNLSVLLTLRQVVVVRQLGAVSVYLQDNLVELLLKLGQVVIDILVVLVGLQIQSCKLKGHPGQDFVRRAAVREAVHPSFPQRVDQLLGLAVGLLGLAVNAQWHGLGVGQVDPYVLLLAWHSVAHSFISLDPLMLSTHGVYSLIGP